MRTNFVLVDLSKLYVCACALRNFHVAILLNLNLIILQIQDTRCYKNQQEHIMVSEVGY